MATTSTQNRPDSRILQAKLDVGKAVSAHEWSYPALDIVAELVVRESVVKKIAVCSLNSGSVSPMFSAARQNAEFGNSIGFGGEFKAWVSSL